MYDINMNESGYIDFEWDDRKAESNVGKHAVTFSEACESFYDPYARVIDEERFILIGMSMSARVLTVCHCVRGEGSTIRIISARKSTRNEERQYWRWRK